jgi:cell division protease FtsH
MVCDWGFSPLLGPIGFAPGGPAYMGRQGLESRTFAEGTPLVIDQDVSRILIEAAEGASAILTARRASLDAVIDLLLEKETIDGEELMAVVRRPREPRRPVAAV